MLRRSIAFSLFATATTAFAVTLVVCSTPPDELDLAKRQPIRLSDDEFRQPPVYLRNLAGPTEERGSAPQHQRTP